MPLRVTGMGVSNALTEAFNLTGKLPLSIDETIVPTVSVGDLQDSLWGPQAAGAIAVPAAIGFRSEIELSLPVSASGIGAAVIVDSITILGLVAGQFYTIGASPGLAAPTIAGNKDWIDNGQPGAPAMLISGKNTAVGTLGFSETLRYRVDNYDIYEVPLSWILREFGPTGVQQGLMIRPGVDNQECRINVRWRERVPR